MPNTKSAIRRTKRAKLQTSVNRIRKSKYKSAIKQMTDYIDSRKIKKAKEFLPEFYSQLMKIAKTGVIKKKTMSRKISRITKKIHNLEKKK
jgi:small subunit ribosomal protein S20|tara:strand:- start:1533 stop:1805 length:273 start_codon:yes stop_codon:yes gene_type:complete